MPNFIPRLAIPALCLCAWGVWLAHNPSSHGEIYVPPRGAAVRTEPLPVGRIRGWVVPVRNGTATLSREQLQKARYLVIGSLTEAPQTVKVELTPLVQREGAATPIPELEVLPQRPGKLATLATKSILPRRREASTADLKTPHERLFRFPISDRSATSTWGLASITGKLIAQGVRSQVFLDARAPEEKISSEARRIVELLDRELIPMFEHRLGRVKDLDGDRRLSLLLTSQLSKMAPQENVGAVPLRGLTWSEDFHPESRLGNHADLIYLNIDLPTGEGMRSLLQHELTHAIFFASQAERSPSLSQEDWLSEGLAHLAETWNNRDSSNWGTRLESFNTRTSEYPLVVPSYAQAGLWRNPGCRGATFQFLSWCEACCGESLGQELLQASGTGPARLEEATGIPFQDLFRLWSCAAVLTPEQLPTDSGKHAPQSPRVQEYHPQETREQPLRGTTFQILQLTGDAEVGIRVKGNSQTQVTLLR